MVGLRLLNRFQRRLQVGPVVEGDLAESRPAAESIVGKIERPGYVELLNRSAVVQQLQQLDLGRAQIDDRCLHFRFILHAQQLDAIQIDLRNVAGLEAITADVDDLVVVVQVMLGDSSTPSWPQASAQRPSAA